MYFRRFCSAFGAGSVATTSKTLARNSAAQLAPMTPVPTIAIRRTGLFNAMLSSPCRPTLNPVAWLGHLNPDFFPTLWKRRAPPLLLGYQEPIGTYAE